MNCRAASLTRAEREKLVLRSSSTRTNTRPLNSLLLLRTSGSIGLVLNSGGSNFSTGMSTSDAIETDLRLALLEDLEVVFGQVADEVALLIGDDRVDLDVVDLDLEGNRRLVGRGLGRWRLLRPQFNNGDARPEGAEDDAEDEKRQANRVGAHKVSKCPRTARAGILIIGLRRGHGGRLASSLLSMLSAISQTLRRVSSSYSARCAGGILDRWRCR